MSAKISKKKTLAPHKQRLLCEYDGGSGDPDFKFPDKIKENMIAICSQDSSHPDNDFNQNQGVPENTVKSSVLIHLAGGPEGIA